MDPKKIFQTFLTPLICLVLGTVIVLIFFRPLLSGKEIRQQDIDSHKGMAKEVIDYREATGEEALWTTQMFGGMPTYQISQINSGNMVSAMNSAYIKALHVQIGYMVMMFVGMFILLLILRVNPCVAAAFALAYTFGSYFYTAIEAGHNSKLNAMSFVAPLIGAVILTYRGKLLAGAGLAALFMGLLISANHYQVAYYAGFAILFLIITEMVASLIPQISSPTFFGLNTEAEKSVQKRIMLFMAASVILLVSAGLGAATDTARLMQSSEYSEWSIRGGKSQLTPKADPGKPASSAGGGVSLQYLTDWSYGIDETFTLMIPNFKGGPSSFDFGKESNLYETVQELTGSNEQAKSFARNGLGYWGNQPFTSGPVYVGAIICYLFLLGLVVVWTRYKWWALVAVIFTCLVAWGKNTMWFTEFMYHNVPMYNKFRAPTQILMFTCMAMVTLGALAVQRILDMTHEERRKWLLAFWVVTGISVAVPLFFAVVGPSLFSFESAADKQRFEGAETRIVEAIIDDRIGFFVADCLRAVIFVLMTAAVLSIVFYVRKAKVPAFAIGISLFVVAGLDTIPVASRYVNADSYRKKVKREALNPTRTGDNTIKQYEKSIHYRVWHQDPNMFNDAQTSMHHKSVGGYFPIKSRRYQELFDNLVFDQKGVNLEVMRMLNTKWVLRDDPKTGDNAAMPFPNPCGNAWFVDAYTVAPNADAEIEAMRTFKADSLAIIPKEHEAHVNGLRIAPDSNATIVLTSYSPRTLTYESNAATEQLAVFSEIHYQPGWNAYVDSKPADHIRADYVLRAMRLPAGPHKVEFRFEPDSYLKGNSYSRIASIVLFVVLAGALGMWVFTLFNKPFVPVPDKKA